MLERTGHDLTLDDARRIIATSIPVFDSPNAAVASHVLGHVNERVTERHYNQARGIEAKPKNDRTHLIDAEKQKSSRGFDWLNLSTTA
jgi:hypothetical protein